MHEPAPYPGTGLLPVRRWQHLCPLVDVRLGRHRNIPRYVFPPNGRMNFKNKALWELAHLLLTGSPFGSLNDIRRLLWHFDGGSRHFLPFQCEREPDVQRNCHDFPRHRHVVSKRFSRRGVDRSKERAKCGG